MSVIHTLIGAKPPARTDDVAWNRVRIEQSPTGTSWTTTATQNLDPLDTDPRYPARQDVTFSSTLGVGYFRLVFLDASDNASAPTEPVFDNGSGVAWRPSVAEVAKVLTARTFVNATIVGSDNNLAGTFNDETRPTSAQIEGIIDTAVTELKPHVLDDVDQEVVNLARTATARRAAMLVVVSFFGESLEEGNSSYDELRQLFLDALADLAMIQPDTSAAAKGIYSIPMRSEVAGYISGDLVP